MAKSDKRKAPAQSQQGDPKVTWDDTAKHIGTDYSGGAIMVADERVDKVMISRYCEPAEIGNLTYWDEEVARMAGYRSQVVPWAMVKEVYHLFGQLAAGRAHALSAGCGSRLSIAVGRALAYQRRPTDAADQRRVLYGHDDRVLRTGLSR